MYGSCVHEERLEKYQSTSYISTLASRIDVPRLLFFRFAHQDTFIPTDLPFITFQELVQPPYLFQSPFREARVLCFQPVGDSEPNTSLCVQLISYVTCAHKYVIYVTHQTQVIMTSSSIYVSFIILPVHITMKDKHMLLAIRHFWVIYAYNRM